MAAAEGLTRIMEVLADAEMRLRDAASKKILVEVALLKAIEARSAVSLDSLLKQLQNLREGKAGEAASIPVPAAAASPKPARAAAAAATPAPAPRAPCDRVRCRAGAAWRRAFAGARRGTWQTSGPGWWKRSAAPARSRALTCSKRTRFRSRRTCSRLASTPSSRITSAWWTTPATTPCCKPSCPNSAIRTPRSSSSRPRRPQTRAPLRGTGSTAAPAPAPSAPPKPAAAAKPAAAPAAPAKEKLASVPFNKDDFKNDPLIQKALEIFKGQIVEVRA